MRGDERLDPFSDVSRKLCGAGPAAIDLGTMLATSASKLAN